MQRLLTALCALVLTATAAFATNVTPLTGPQDPSQLQAVVNTLIVSGNSNWNPQGTGFLSAAQLTGTASVAVTFSQGLGPTGATSGIVSWWKVKGYTNNTTTPTTFFIPMWGCTAGAGVGC